MWVWYFFLGHNRLVIQTAAELRLCRWRGRDVTFGQKWWPILCHRSDLKWTMDDVFCICCVYVVVLLEEDRGQQLGFAQVVRFTYVNLWLTVGFKRPLCWPACSPDLSPFLHHRILHQQTLTVEWHVSTNRNTVSSPTCLHHLERHAVLYIYFITAAASCCVLWNVPSGSVFFSADEIRRSKTGRALTWDSLRQTDARLCIHGKVAAFQQNYSSFV